MRPFFSITCLIVAASLVCATRLDARGGKGGGGGGGRGRASSGGGHGGGGHKWGSQQSHSGGGGQRLAEHGQRPTSGGGKHQFADKPNQSGKDKEHAWKDKEHAWKDKEHAWKDKEHAWKDKEHDKVDRFAPTSDSGDIATDPYNKKLKQLAIEQQHRDRRLAQAQHLREIGERNGNQNLIDNADRMEAFAHDHYARRVSHLEKFGVTDPLLNPGGGVTDPLLPGTGGLVNPVGDVGLLDLLPIRP